MIWQAQPVQVLPRGRVAHTVNHVSEFELSVARIDGQSPHDTSSSVTATTTTTRYLIQ